MSSQHLSTGHAFDDISVHEEEDAGGKRNTAGSDDIELPASLVQAEDEEMAAPNAFAGQRLGPYSLVRELPHKAPTISGSKGASAGVGRRWMSLLEADMVPEERYHNRKYKIGERLGTGTYGVTYLATRERCDGKPCRGADKYVAVKFIYQRRTDGGFAFATGLEADRKLQEEMQRMVRECGFVKALQAKKAQNPEGASKITACHEACCPTCIKCKTRPNEPMYIVMDYAGEDGFYWIAKHADDKAAVADVLTQIIMGVGYLSHLDPPVIHHDLKWENIAIVESKTGTSRRAKLIDFGATISATKVESKELTVVTPEYEPPESVDGFAYQGPAGAYDTFGIGIMALEGLCGFKDDAGLDSLRKEVWVEYRRKQSHIVEYMDTLGLKDYEAFCARSIAPLLAPDPYNRPDPIAVRFTASGAVIRKNSAATSAFYLPSEKTSNVSTVTVPTRTTRFS